MAITITAEHTHTFAQLRKWALAEAKVSDHFAFRKLGPSYETYWEGMNHDEYRRGYVAGEYEKPGSPALCDMTLLTQREFSNWQGTFNYFHKK